MALSFLGGRVRVLVKSVRRERLLNLLAARGISFTDFTAAGEEDALMTLSAPAYRALRRLERETGAFTVKPLRRSGAPFLLWSVRGRWALLAGVVLALTLPWLSALFIWQIDVTGNETVPEAVILSALREEGITLGTPVFAVRREFLANQLLLRLPELSWITVNLHGSRAHVLCREKVPAPEVVDWTKPGLVTARREGLVTRVTVLRGRAACAAGDTVLPGETLIEPTATAPRAAGSVLAVTRYELTAVMPLRCTLQTPTGEEKTGWSLCLGEKRKIFSVSGGNPYPSCDKIESEYTLRLPDGSPLPLRFVRTTWAETAQARYDLSPEKAETILRARLLERLGEEVAEGHIHTTEFRADERNGAVTVTLTALCEEEIAVTEEIPHDGTDDHR